MAAMRTPGQDKRREDHSFPADRVSAARTGPRNDVATSRPPDARGRRHPRRWQTTRSSVASTSSGGGSRSPKTRLYAARAAARQEERDRTEDGGDGRGENDCEPALPRVGDEGRALRIGGRYQTAASPGRNRATNSRLVSPATTSRCVRGRSSRSARRPRSGNEYPGGIRCASNARTTRLGGKDLPEAAGQSRLSMDRLRSPHCSTPSRTRKDEHGPENGQNDEHPRDLAQDPGSTPPRGHERSVPARGPEGTTFALSAVRPAEGEIGEARGDSISGRCPTSSHSTRR